MAVVYRASASDRDAKLRPGTFVGSDEALGLRRPPLLPGALPLLGHGLGLRRNPIELIQRGRERFGDIFRVELPGHVGVVMTGLAAQSEFFRLSDADVSQEEPYQLMTPILGRGLGYDAPPGVMAEQLGFLHDALEESKLKIYVRAFAEEAQKFFDRWGGSGAIDMREAGHKVSLNLMTRVLMGPKFRATRGPEFAQLYDHMSAGLNLLAFVNPNLPLPAFRRRDRARERVAQLIASHRAKRVDSDDERASIMANLVEARYADGRRLLDDELTGLLVATMFAGHPPTAATFAWTGILLSQHPELMRRLREEQHQVLAAGEQPELESLRAMPLLEATIKEVLRMYPPIALMMRKVVNGFQFNDYDVAAGDIIFTCPAVAHHIPELFTEPHRFDPERFLADRAEDKKNPMGWLAFGAGRHRCMGAVFALLQLKSLWSHLLLNFEFELGDSVYEPDYSQFIVGPRRPCTLKYRRLSPRRRSHESAVKGVAE